MIGQFKSCGIKTIINLQKPGEHPYCGHGLVEGAGKLPLISITFTIIPTFIPTAKVTLITTTIIFNNHLQSTEHYQSTSSVKLTTLSLQGFSYDPQLFMDNGIFHYNFGWDDYGVTTISTLLDMVRVFKFATDEGKVAVHCHAGEIKRLSLDLNNSMHSCKSIFDSIHLSRNIMYMRKK